MVIFNPDVQKVQERDYLGWSKAIEQPQFVSGTEATLKGLGTIAKDMITGADQLIKTQAESEARKGAQAEQDVEIEKLNAAKGAVNLMTMDPEVYNARAEAQTLVPPEQYGPPMPASLKKLPYDLSVRETAKGAGKLTETDYYGRLVQLAKDLRSKYPGYTEYIDQEISRVTGVNPANKLIQSTLADINAALSKTDDARKAAISLGEHAVREGVFSEDGPTQTLASTQLAKLRKGQMTPEAFEDWYNKTAAPMFREKARSANWKTLEGNKDALLNQVEQDNGASASRKLSTAMEVIDSNIKELGVTFDSKGMVTDTKMLPAAGNAIVIAENNYRRELEKTVRTPMWQGGPSQWTLDSKRAQTWIDTQVKAFEPLKEMIYNGQWGLIGSAARFAKGIKDSDHLEGLRDKDIGWVLRQNDLYKDAPGWLQAQWQAAVLAKLPENSKQYFTAQRFDLMHTDPLNPLALKEVVDRAQRDKQDIPGGYEGLWDLYFGPSQSFINPNADLTPEKAIDFQKSLARSLTASKNYGILARLPQQTFDDQGNIIKGSQVSFFMRLAGPDFQKTMFDLDKASPGVWNNYRGLLEKEASGVIRTEINDLGTLQNQPNLGIAWDKDNHRWHLQLKYNGKVVDPTAENIRPGRVPLTEDKRPIVDEPSLRTAARSINKLNIILGWLRNTPASAGKDEGEVDTHLFGIMQTIAPQLRMDPSKIEGLPAKFIETFKTLTEQAEKKKQEQTVK